MGCSEEEPEPNIASCRITNYKYSDDSDVRTFSYNYSNNLVSSIDLTIILYEKTYTLSAQLEYDDQNRIVSIKTDDENYVGITYDNLSIEVRTNRSRLSSPIVDNYTLNDKGQIIEWVGHVTEEYDYNEKGQLIREYATWSNGEEAWSAEFQYDNMRNPFENIPAKVNWSIPTGEDAQIMFDFAFKNMMSNNIIKADYSNPDGDVYVSKEYEFTYDSNDYPISSTIGIIDSEYSYDSCD